MMRRSLLLIAMGSTLATISADAQGGKKMPPPKKVEKGQAPPEWMVSRKGRLGIIVDLEATENDSIGATVASVTPRGPAAAAGIRAGDIILSLNGKRLVVQKPEDADSEEDAKVPEGQSTAGLRLVELASKLDPGSKAEIEFRRGKRTLTVTVVTSSEPVGMVIDFAPQLLETPAPPFQKGMKYPAKPGMKFGEFKVAPRVFIQRDKGEEGATLWFKAMGPLAEVELAPMNPDLGEYFGTSEGVLVINAPKDNDYRLKGGDVILAINGESVSDPVSVFKLLHMKKQGETKLEIMRNKERQTLTAREESQDELELKLESK